MVDSLTQSDSGVGFEVGEVRDDGDGAREKWIAVGGGEERSCAPSEEGRLRLWFGVVECEVLEGDMVGL